MADSLAMSPSPAMATKHVHSTSVLNSVKSNSTTTVARISTRELTPESDEDTYFGRCATSPSSTSSSIRRNWSGNNVTLSDDENLKSDNSDALDKSYEDDDKDKLECWDEDKRYENKNLKRSREVGSENSDSEYDGLYKDKINEANFASVVRASSPGQLINNAIDYFKSRSPSSVNNSMFNLNDISQEPRLKKSRRETDADDLAYIRNTRRRVSDHKIETGESDGFKGSTEAHIRPNLVDNKSMVVDAFRTGLSKAFDMFAKDVAIQTLQALMDQGIQIKSQVGESFQNSDSGANNQCVNGEPKAEAIDLAIKNYDKRYDKDSGYDAEQRHANRNVSSSSFTVEGEAKELRTASQSQLCFGNVQVHPSSSSSMKMTSIPTTFTSSLASLKSLYDANMMAAFSPMLLSKSDKRSPYDHVQITNKCRSRSTSSNSSSQALKSDSRPPSSVNKRTSPSQTPLTPTESTNNKYEARFTSKTTKPNHANVNRSSTPITSPEPKFFKPYKPDSTNNSVYGGFLSQFGSSAGKFLNNPMYQALASAGLMDKSVSSILPAMNQTNCSTSRGIPNMQRNGLIHPTSTRSSLNPNIPVTPFFPPPPGFQNSPLAALYPLPLLQNQFGRQSARHNDYFDSMRMPPQPSLRSGMSRNSRSSIDVPSEYRDNDGSPYSMAKMHEGLTPQHLKKAKLLFFYNRYPSANTLRTFFPDVNFDRAITSQLIKWFSNFREFFYIQMEKFARQALTDGIRDTSQLKISRDCELLRVLNLHYNKCNDFKVPSKFIKVTEASLREFFLAVKAGKDKDPAWKKVIYKVICKLDFEIPEIFKSPSVLDRLHEIRD